MHRIISLSLTLLLLILPYAADADPIVEAQSLKSLKVNRKQFETLKVITNHGTFSYHLDNSGTKDVSGALQHIFDEIGELKDISATFEFIPGIYYLASPVKVKISSVKMMGHAHGGIDIHGANLAGGTLFRLGKGAAPYAFTFNYDGRSCEFPSGLTPSINQNLKVELENLSFAGYNNTGVNTADGYSRFRNGTPNFRGLHWFPSSDRYGNNEKEGQRAIYLPPAPKVKGGIAKCELLRVTGCYFTDLYVGLEVANCDVSYINKNWFGQLAYAIRMKGAGQGMMVSENLFADLETAVTAGRPIFSTFNNNVFAYVSKCFELGNVTNSTISNNTLYNWKISTGAAAYGSFCYVKQSSDLSVTGNTITQQLDSRKRNITTDDAPNGEAFIQFNNSTRLQFSDNIINTIITESVVRLHNSKSCVVIDNIINYGKGGQPFIESGNCSNNYYREINFEDQ